MARPHLRIIPLGGLGEIGKNMLALELDKDMVVIDAGVMFPEENLPGVDLIIPDISYLKERRNKLKGILITHGHEDHTGALPYVLPELKVPVYAPRLAHGLITVKLREHRLLREASLEVVEPGKPFNLGKFRVEFFRVCHSIPDAMGLIVQTPLGIVVHTGDFKIDHTPVDGKITDLTKLAHVGRQGVFLLLADSTYAELPGYTPSEAVVGEALHRAIGEAPGRVMIATFASLISRVQQVLTAAARYGRKVAIVGRSMVDNVNIATKMGYLTPPEGVLVPLEQAKRLPPEQVVLITTGSQGEPTSALVRIANRDHREIQVIPGDTVIISATPIPGNETVVSRTINNLFRQGARVLYDKVATVHVHGHASQEELKLMLNLARPRFFIPVHGEYRHLVVHAQLAQSLGVPRENTFVLEDGQVLDLTAKGGGVVERIPAGHIYVDGTRARESKSSGTRDKKPLAEDGVLVIVIARDRKTGRLSRPPEVISSGLVDQEQELPLTNAVAHLVMATLDHEGPSLDWSLVNSKVKESVSNYLYKELGRRPMIVPVALEV